MKILLVQTAFLGDIVLSTPVVAALRQCHPTAELWILTTPSGAELLSRDPELSGCIPFDKHGSQRGVFGLFAMARRLRRMNFQRVYSLHRSWRTSLLLYLARIPERIGFTAAKLSFLYTRLVARDHDSHDVIRNLSLLSDEAPLDSLPQRLRLFAPDLAEVSERISSLVDHETPYAVLHPGSAWPTKRWFSEGYRDVASWLVARGFRVLALGTSSEHSCAEQVCEDTGGINLAGQTSLSETLYVVKHAALSVCNDSMALHLASTFKIPTVTIFCATSPRFGFGPWDNRAVVVEKEGLHCKPCRRHGGMRCPTGTEACMRELSSAKVIQAIETVLDQQDQRSLP